MKRYEAIVVSCTLLVLTVWFFTNNFGGVYFSTPPGLSLKGIKGDVVVTGKEKEESLKRILEIVERKAQ